MAVPVAQLEGVLLTEAEAEDLYGASFYADSSADRPTFDPRGYTLCSGVEVRSDAARIMNDIAHAFDGSAAVASRITSFRENAAVQYVADLRAAAARCSAGEPGGPALADESLRLEFTEGSRRVVLVVVRRRNLVLQVGLRSDRKDIEVVSERLVDSLAKRLTTLGN